MVRSTKTFNRNQLHAKIRPFTGGFFVLGYSPFSFLPSFFASYRDERIDFSDEPEAS
jgi:hypothetical protein